MNRSGYTDDFGEDQWAMIRYRGAVASATKGSRGQALLRELLDALDAMSEKRLVANEFQADGSFCALGVLGAKRGIDMRYFTIDEETGYDPILGESFNVADALVREIMYENDECVDVHGNWVAIEICGPMWLNDEWRRSSIVRVPVKNADERRWRYMRSWVAAKIKPAPDGAEAGRSDEPKDLS